MELSQETFISSTMWTDRLGFIAANTTINKLKKKNINSVISGYGRQIKKGWVAMAKKNNIKIRVSGLDSIPSFIFDYKNNKEISTFFIQEMLKKGFLANTTLATTYAYNKKIIQKYLKTVDSVFKKIKLSITDKKFLLHGPIRHSTFRRLTG